MISNKRDREDKSTYSIVKGSTFYFTNKIYKTINEANAKAKTGNIENKIDVVNDLFYEDIEKEKLHNDLEGYLSNPEGVYRKSTHKRKGVDGDPLSYLDPLCKSLSFAASYIISDYEYDDLPVIPLESIEIDYTYGKNQGKRNKFVSITNNEDESSANKIDMNSLEDYLNNDNTYKLSEAKKRRQRWEKVKEDLDKYPELMEAYKEYKRMGLKFGFDMEEYTKQERLDLKIYWLSKFKKDGVKSPSFRYKGIQKNYNQMGYDLYLMWEKLVYLMEPRKQNQVKYDVDYDSQIETEFDLSNHEHIKSLFSIDRDNRTREYIPIYKPLKEEYKDKIDSYIYILLSEFEDIITYVDFSESDIELINIVLGQHELDIYMNNTIDPFKILTIYLNEKYGGNRPKSYYVNRLNGKISKRIANTYSALFIDEVGFVECTSCGKKKVSNNDHFGVDNRKENGLKSICKKCDANSK